MSSVFRPMPFGRAVPAVDSSRLGEHRVPCLFHGRGVRSYFKHSVELVDGEGDIVDILAAVKDFLLAHATYQAAKQRWPKERIRLSQQSRIVSDSSRDPS
jgi:hypothetical protein